MNQRKRTTSGAWTFNLDESGQSYNLTEFQKLAEKFKDDSALSIEEKYYIKLFLELYEKKVGGEKNKEK
ncbi:hypothetical protein ES703_70626 [subsurface metagenome]